MTSSVGLLLVTILLVSAVQKCSSYAIRSQDENKIPASKVNAILSQIDTMLDTIRMEVAGLRDTMEEGDEEQATPHYQIRQNRYKKRTSSVSKWRKARLQKKRDYDIPFPFHGGFSQ